jgi:hypothetical protein
LGITPQRTGFYPQALIAELDGPAFSLCHVIALTQDAKADNASPRELPYTPACFAVTAYFGPWF